MEGKQQAWRWQNTFSNRSVFSGEWADDSINGRGTMNYFNGKNIPDTGKTAKSMDRELSIQKMDLFRKIEYGSLTISEATNKIPPAATSPYPLKYLNTWS